MKIKTFLKNYKKIIIGIFLILLIVSTVSAVCIMYTMRREISDNRKIQLADIEQKSEDVSECYGYLENIYYQEEVNYAARVIDLLKLRPEGLEDKELLDSYCTSIPSLTNLVILDGDLETYFTYGTVRDVDYKDSYYSELFAGEEGEAVILYDKDSSTLKTTAQKSGDYYFLVQTDDETIGMGKLSRKYLWKTAFDMVGSLEESNMAAIDLSDNTVIYSDIDELTGQTLDIGTSSEYTADINGVRYLIQTHTVEDQNVLLAALTPLKDIASRCRSIIVILIIVYLVAVVLLVAYVLCLRQGELDPTTEYRFGGKYFIKSQTSRYKGFAAVIGIVAVIMFIVFSGLNHDAYVAEVVAEESETYAGVVEYFSDMETDAEDTIEQNMYGYDKVIQLYLDANPEGMTKQELTKVATALDVKYITIFDSDGQTECTSSPLDNLNITEDSSSSLYGLRLALIGKEEVEVTCDSAIMDDGYVMYAIPRRNSDGEADGIIAVTAEDAKTSVEDAMQPVVSAAANAYSSLNDTKVYTLDNTGSTVAVGDVKNSSSVFRLADLGLTYSDIRYGFNGRIEYNNVSYLASVSPAGTTAATAAAAAGSNTNGTVTGTVDNTTAAAADTTGSTSDTTESLPGNYVMVTSPIYWLYGTSLSKSIIFAFLYLLMACWICYDGLGSKYHFEERPMKVKDADDWKRRRLTWAELPTARKMEKILRVVVYIFSIYLLILQILVMQGAISENGIGGIASGNWKKSLNIYSIFANICLICVFFTVVSFIQIFLRRIENILGSESATICRTIGSCIKYAATLFCLFKVIMNFGLDVKTALASAGIIGLGITFGAQDLLKDMMAGMFIIFEGNYKVGDMLLVDNQWYWVKNIGVRTTKLVSWGQVKIINNSSMTGILNLQNATACVNCDITIGPEYDISYVQSVMEKELAGLKEMLPPEVSTPVFKGVQGLDAAGVTIRISDYCPPLQQGKVGRFLRGEIKRILDENGIKLAYDAYAVHNSSATPEEVRTIIEETSSSSDSSDPNQPPPDMRRSPNGGSDRVLNEQMENNGAVPPQGGIL